MNMNSYRILSFFSSVLFLFADRHAEQVPALAQPCRAETCHSPGWLGHPRQPDVCHFVWSLLSSFALAHKNGKKKYTKLTAFVMPILPGQKLRDGWP